MYYKELFKLFNYTDAEIEKDKERIEKAFKKADIGAANSKLS